MFRWTVPNGPCTVFDDVTLTNILNTVAAAGQDQVVGNVNSFSLNGNTPDAGNTGLWTLVNAPSSSTAVINQPGSPATTVNMVNKVGDYIFNWTITNGAFSNTDELRVTVSSVLPVSLVSFTGAQKNEYVHLTWQTATENNNDHFNLERSLDGIQFSAIGSVKGAGTSALSHDYSYYDNIKELTTPVMYYRLVQVDYDGKLTYSQVLKFIPINTINTDNLSIWPNPFRNKIHLKSYFNSAGMVRISLYDYSGKSVQVTHHHVVQGYNYIDVDQLDKFKPGIVILEVAKDEFIYRKKLIK